MAVKKIENLSSYQLDVLREVGNIGAGHAATALATLLSDRVSMSVPKLEIVDIKDAAMVLGGPENPVVGILMTLSEDIKGIIMLVYEEKFLNVVIRTLLGKNIDGLNNLSEMDLSVFMEVGNIMVGTYLNALSELTKLNIGVSPPDICADMAGAVMSYPVSIFGMGGDKVLMIQEHFSGSEQITSHLIMMPENESLEKILRSLGAD
ncbi:MAG: chemotaxis protein CheC [Eubacteriales bacterium]|nr:chemotaxis protein CheC [Eubacteriales bacterium]MDD4422333.1 chemotaxis protein CheC [Eubacteriales bacterium]HBR31857.1 chemotaxis protein CheC [Clostridiales bacterium]